MKSLKALSYLLWTVAGAALVGVVALAMAGSATVQLLGVGALTVQLDLVTTLLLVLILGVGAVVAAFAATHLEGEPRPAGFVLALGGTLAGLSLAVTAVHLPVLWLGWATASLGLMALVRWRHTSAAARRPARYVAAWLAVGDVLLLAAVLALVSATGTTDRTELAVTVPGLSAVTVTTIAALLAAAGIIRSALVPAHRWLPETAAAPTPVSALLHAGIVNGAGVLAVLLWPVFAAAPVVLVALVVVGAISILAASVIASVRPDVKGRLAASTTAQMGFMTIQVGVGAPAAALFHLIGHGFYKATLFLGAGSGVNALRRGRSAPGTSPTRSARLRVVAAVALPVSIVLLMAATVTPPLHGVGTVVLYAAATTTAAVMLYRLLDPAFDATTGFRSWATAAVAALLVAYLAGMYAFETAVEPEIGVTASPLSTPVQTVLVVALLAAGAAAAFVDRRARAGNAPRLVVRAVAAAMSPGRVRRRTLGGEQPVVVATPVERARARASVEAASQLVAPAWPLGQFVASNPLAGLEHLTFDEATERAAQVRGGRTTLDAAHYQRLYRAGQIDDAALAKAIVEQGEVLALPPQLPQQSWVAVTRAIIVGNQRASAPLRAAARAAAESLGARAATLVGAAPAPTTLSRQVDVSLGTTLDARIVDAASAWLAYVLADEDVRWKAAPGPLFARWRRLAECPAFDATIGVEGFADALAEVPERADEAVAEHLTAMAVADDEWSAYLAASLSRVPGWASHVAWLEREARTGSASLLDLAAILLSIERFMVDAETRAAWGEPGTTAAIAEHPVTDTGCPLAPVAELIEAAALAGELDADSLGALDDVVLIALVRYSTAVRRAAPAIWRSAHEATFRDPIIAELSAAAATAQEPGSVPDAQAVFCIDVRSEPLRRHLESSGDTQTLGFAGFFALPFHHQQLDAAGGTDQCPVLLTPRHVVREVAGQQSQVLASRALSGARAMSSTSGAASDAQRAPNSAFSFAEAAGWMYAPVTVLRTAVPAAWFRLRAAARERVRPTVPTRQTVDQTPDGLGFAPDEQLFLAEAALRTMGLTRNFARLVVITGHGSHTENNPFEAAYDCGACGGNPGGANARALAAMLNAGAVRERLSQVGIDVPDTTWFVPAEHDTTDDTVTLLDTDQVPASHCQDVARFSSVLGTATLALSRERVSTLPGAPLARDGRAARRHVQRRAADWAQTRPEWGLAGNAAFVVGDRSVTEACNLEGRAFLHSYRWQDDDDGAALEVILTAPMVVAEWINTQYYFSSVDPDHFGSGSKVLHNLVGRVGVLSGPRGDLKPGLPLQAVAERVDADGVLLRHAPLRLLTVVQAPLDRVAAVVERNPVLQKLFGNGWVSLVVLDPSRDAPQRYTPGSQWRPWFGDAADSADAPASATGESPASLHVPVLSPSTPGVAR